jgi:glycosyltransferase involved in cell wall biosynthesis
MFVLPNGVDLTEFRDLPSRDELEVRYPHLQGKVVALFMGRIHLQKGLDVLIPALEKAIKEVPSLHLVIAGPDERNYRAVIEQSVREAKLTSAVDFVGSVFGQDKRLALGGADFFVLTSHHEGDSVAVKEAMAAGLPVLVSRACCFPEISDQGMGIIVTQDVDEIADGLIRLGESKELRRSMGMKARLFINNCYRWEDIVDRLIGIYQDILAGKRSSHCRL